MSEATIAEFMPTQAPSTIELNVGGQIFTTLKETLCRAGGIFPHMFVQFEQWPKDSTGRLFIDRDPLLFRILLDWIRNLDRPFYRRITEDMVHEMRHFGMYPDLLFEKKQGMLIHVQGKGLQRIEQMTLLHIIVGGIKYLHTAYDGSILRT